MKTIRKISVLAALLAALSATAGAKALGESVATVNDEPILRSDYQKNVDLVTEKYMRTAPSFFQQKDAKEQLEKTVLDKMINDLLFEQEAQKEKIKVRERELEDGIAELKKPFFYDDNGKQLTEKEAEDAFTKGLADEGLSYEQFKTRVERRLSAEKLIRQNITPKLSPPDEKETKKLFDRIEAVITKGTATLAGMPDEDAQELVERAQRYKDLSAERVKVRHIFIKADETSSLAEKNKAAELAADIKKQLDGGANFAELAKKYSQDSESASRGGDIGAMIRGMGLPAEFEDAAFSLAVGGMSAPVLSKLGYHIVKVEEKRAAQPLSYDEIKDELAQILMNKQMQSEITKWLKELRAKASITLNK